MKRESMGENLGQTGAPSISPVAISFFLAFFAFFASFCAFCVFKSV
jgi:hypothetical protein